MRPYQDKVRDILANVDRYHRAYYEAETFRGPSLYFHRRALETRQSPGDLAHLECVYATLASGGCTEWARAAPRCRALKPFGEALNF